MDISLTDKICARKLNEKEIFENPMKESSSGGSYKLIAFGSIFSAKAYVHVVGMKRANFQDSHEIDYEAINVLVK